MNWKQGIRWRRQATGEEGVYEGRKQCRMLFICYKKQIGRATILHGSYISIHIFFFNMFVIDE